MGYTLRWLRVAAEKTPRIVMDVWLVLLEMTALLGGAFVLGALAERFGQSAIVGYLMAGVVAGPLLFSADAVRSIAELGVALLLFSIGLQFSFGRLRRLGRVALVGGTLQVTLTLAVFALVAGLFFPTAQAVALGAMIALSSTAVVLRMLMASAELDSVRGRNSVGVLLLQDIAVVPLVLLVTMLGQGGSAGEVLTALAKTVLGAGLLVGVFYLLFFKGVPRLLHGETVSRNHELVILLAIVSAVGSTWGAHALGLSPALGAFLAGLLLAESPFATQIRADVAPLRTLFVTLFFTSIGMLVEPVWMLTHLHVVLLGLGVVLLGKTVIVFAIMRWLGQNRYDALATGLTLAQIGEFSFVLATVARGSDLVSADTFALIVSVTILSLFAAPFLVGRAIDWSEWAVRRAFPDGGAAPATAAADVGCRVFVIGFGPAGRRVAEMLIELGQHPIVIEQNPNTARAAMRLNLVTHVGNARQSEVLGHAGVAAGCYVIVTVPDPRTALAIVAGVRGFAPDAHVLARARYHIWRYEIEQAGANNVVDEETEVGHILAERAARAIGCHADDPAGACSEAALKLGV
jgi:K+:H+ antiporter